MAIPKKDPNSGTIVINPVVTEVAEFCILGREPVIMNRMSQKAQRELLLPSGRKTATEKAISLKHDPIAEFRASAYRLTNPDAPTLLAIPAPAFKAAMGTAALDLPGTKKTQIGRLVYVRGVDGMYIPCYGTPELLMSVVRSADINRTPDIRTRVILREWACKVRIEYVKPILQANAIMNLLSAAGVTAGVCDWRPEKGKGTFGQFEIVNEDDERYQRIVSSQGRRVQAQALDAQMPVCFDDETSTLLAWFLGEIEARRESGRGATTTDRKRKVGKVDESVVLPASIASAIHQEE